MIGAYWSFPAFFWPGNVAKRASARFIPGPKVSFASLVRWGTEPEGWCVDLPYADFLRGVNYSPLECLHLIDPASMCQSPEHDFSCS